MTDSPEQPISPAVAVDVPPPPHFMRCLTPPIPQGNNSLDPSPTIVFDQSGRCRVTIEDEHRPSRRVRLTTTHWAIVGVFGVLFVCFAAVIYARTRSVTAALGAAFAMLISIPILAVLHGTPVSTFIPRPRNTVGMTFDPDADRVRCDLAGIERPLSALRSIQVLEGSIDAGMSFPWQLTLIFKASNGHERVLIHTGYGELTDEHRRRLARLDALLSVPVFFYRIRGWRTPVSEIFLDQPRLGRIKRVDPALVRAAAVEPLGPAWDALGRDRFDALAVPLPPVRATMTCLKCRYELVGLAGDAVCPECGEPIRVVRAGASAMQEQAT